jgi:nucleolin
VPAKQEEPAAKKQRVEVNDGGDAEPASATVFVGNLPWSATEEELREFFAECGEINSVRIGEGAPAARTTGLAGRGVAQAYSGP